jgi:hypothetical protein
MRQGMESAWTGICQGRGWERTVQRLSWTGNLRSGTQVRNRPHTEPIALLLADSELGNNGFIPFRVVLLQIVEQTSTPAHHHQKSAARAVVFLVRFEVFRELTNALAEQRDLNFGAAGIGSVRAIRVNDGLFLLSG